MATDDHLQPDAPVRFVLPPLRGLDWGVMLAALLSALWWLA
jgi:hypothetical protein